MKNNQFIHKALISTFVLLYMFVAYVSTLHAITFFQIGNGLGLSIILAIAFELGQASVLFAILTNESKNALITWSMMILLTAVQISGNVYSTFLFIETSGSDNWQYWQKVMLFWVEADGPEMFKVIISYVQGALLPIVALGMTALVAESIKLRNAGNDKEPVVSNKPDQLVDVEVITDKKPIEKSLPTETVTNITPPIIDTSIGTVPSFASYPKKPIDNQRGWHLKKEFIDSNGDLYKFGQFQPVEKSLDDKEPKKA